MLSGIPEKRSTWFLRPPRNRRNIPPPLRAIRVVFDADAHGTTAQLAMCRWEKTPFKPKTIIGPGSSEPRGRESIGIFTGCFGHCRATGKRAFRRRRGPARHFTMPGPHGRLPLGRVQVRQVLPPLKTPANGFTGIAAPSHNPYVTALAPGANRIAKGIWTHSAWEQRAPIMRRFCDFAKRNDLEVQEENVPLFIVSLQLTKSSAV
ncbi:hypothetical protein DQ04_11441000, partial [Trypanosoma grayi]|uniref:hypothetical protein n=1 Tax=Trypanosoma grayi TaxID=71804 RepID=UPI0004F44AE7